MVGGSCSSIIGFFCFDPWLIKMSGVAKYLIRAEDFASDCVVLCLASASTTRKIIFLDYYYSVNKSVTVVTLVFVRVRSFTINSRTEGWKERAICSCLSLIFITSFHRQASTMIFNKQNMVF